MKFQNALKTIGNTPVVKINNLFNSDHEIWIKLEKKQPGRKHQGQNCLGHD